MEAIALSEAKFIDLFAGCGGLSLGLMQAGLQGLFAVELDPMAFRTLEHNLAQPSLHANGFTWPTWLPQEAMSIERLLKKHSGELALLQSEVEVVVGGPPCQGFSFAGRRNAKDPRNELFLQYVRAVDTVRPSFVVLENVPGMKIPHAGLLSQPSSRPTTSHFERLCQELGRIGYKVEARIVDPVEYGVPQRRRRLIALGAREDIAMVLKGGVERLFQLLEESRRKQLAKLGLNVPISVKDAISDLETSGRMLVSCEDADSPKGFKELAYQGPRTHYQKTMNGGEWARPMNSMRLARHRDHIRERFTQILEDCPRGVRLDKEARARFSLRKNRIFPMAEDEPAPTITTLPDDILHYSEPRILTVRECARLQSFPDWFQFKGNFTTGGHRRKLECPRYTQVGNAVPPLLARAIGSAISLALAEVRKQACIQAAISSNSFTPWASKVIELGPANIG